MKSNDVFRQIYRKHSVKEIAEVTGSKEAYVYKWSQRDGGKGSGGWNPLERILALLRLTKNLLPLHWLCQQMGGYFVFNPHCAAALPKDLLCAENEVTEDFGEMLTLISKAAKNKGISRKESESIRMEWERLKSLTEGFVKCCEQGDFQSLRTSTATGASQPANGATRSRA